MKWVLANRAASDLSKSVRVKQVLALRTSHFEAGPGPSWANYFEAGPGPTWANHTEAAPGPPWVNHIEAGPGPPWANHFETGPGLLRHQWSGSCALMEMLDLKQWVNAFREHIEWSSSWANTWCSVSKPLHLVPINGQHSLNQIRIHVVPIMYKGGRPRDPIWDHFTVIEVGGKKSAQCKTCLGTQSMKADRMKAHHKKCIQIANNPVSMVQSVSIGHGLVNIGSGNGLSVHCPVITQTNTDWQPFGS